MVVTDDNSSSSGQQDILDAGASYEESLDLFKSVLDKLDEYTNNNNSISLDSSVLMLSSNQSNTLINSLSRINGTTISSIIMDSDRGKSNNRHNKNIKMDSEYIIKELLKRRKEYRAILHQKQKLLREHKQRSAYAGKQNGQNGMENGFSATPEELISNKSTAERLRQFHEFSSAQQKLNRNMEYEKNAASEAELINRNAEPRFHIDDLHNYNFKQENSTSRVDYLRRNSIESWSHEEVLENYDEILQNYLLHTSTSNDTARHFNVDGFIQDGTDSQFFNNSIFSKAPAKQSMKISLIIGLIVALGGLVYGFDSGLINNLIGMSYFVDHFQTKPEGFTTSQISIIVTSLSIGTFVGALVAPFSMNRFGRKPTIICSVWVFLTIGNIVQITASNISQVIAGRTISGLGVGILSAAIPNYQSEISHKNIRGAIICTFQWAITWGLLLSSVVSQGTHNKKTKASYQVPMGLQFFWAVFLGCCMFYLPESPRYYVMKGQLNKAAEALSFVRGVPITDTGLLEELVEVKANYDYETSLSTVGGMMDCFRDSPTRYKQRLRLFTAISLQFFQQMSGINFIFYYGVSFFQKTGIHSTYILSLITYAVNVAFNIPGLFLIDIIGRRQLLIWGAIIMTMSNYLVAIFSAVKMPSSLSKRGLETLKFCFICSFIASFSATFGGCTWVVSAEIFPLGIRSQCTSISAAANWFANVVCAAMTPFIFDEGSSDSSNKKYAHSQIFFLWASLNFLAIFAVWFLVYETSGLTLEEIDELYTSSKNARDSVKVNRNIKRGDSYMTGFLTLAKSYRNNKKNNIGKKKDFETKNDPGDNKFDKNESDLGATYISLSDNETHLGIGNDNDNPNKDDDIFFKMVAAQNIEKKKNSKDGSESEIRNEDSYSGAGIDLGNGLEIAGFPRSIPSTSGISTSYNANDYFENSNKNIIDRNEIKLYLNLKEQQPLAAVQPIFIANQRTSEPPNLSSDDEND